MKDMRSFNSILAVITAAALLGIVGLLFLSERENLRADATISLSRQSPEYAAFSNEEQSRLRFGVAPVLSPAATLKNYEALATYLGDRLGKPVELVQGKNYAEINALVRSGDVSLALVCSGAFATGRREFGMRALAIPVVNGQRTYNSYLIVPSRSEALTWEDLRQKTFAFTDPLSNTGRIVPVYVLSQMGETPEKFFRSVTFTYGHDRSIKAVAEGLIDGAAVDSLVYDFIAEHDPALAAKARVIWRSPPYGINPVVINPSLPSAMVQRIEDVLFGMSRDPKGQMVLKSLGIDAFERPDPSAYDLIETMIRAVVPE